MASLNKCILSTGINADNARELRERTAAFINQGEDPVMAGQLAAEELFNEAQEQYNEVKAQLPAEFFQKEKKKKLGGIQFPKDGIGGGKTTISFTPNADLSTFIHETGHFIFEMYRDIASQPDANPKAIEEMEALRKWLGVESDDQIEVKHHGQIARGFEAYLREGKAPTQELQGMFSRMKGWLMHLYKSIKELDVELNDDVRRVFDRMLATDEAINEAEQQMNLKTGFSADSDLMTSAEYNAYSESIQQAHEEAQRDLEKKAIAEYERGQKEAYKEELRSLTAEIQRQLSELPSYQAKHYLMSGKQPNGDPLPEGMVAAKLSRNALNEMYPDGEMIKRLPVGKNSVIAKKGGSHPDDIAMLFGYESGDAMIRAIVESKSISVVAKAEAKARMKAKYGDMLNNPEQLAKEAIDSVYRDERANVMLVELKALEKRVGLDPTPMQVLRDSAKRIIGEKKVSEIKEYTYIREQTKYARLSYRLVAEGDYAAARDAKRKQLLNYYLFMEARKATKKIEKVQRHAARLNKKKQKTLRGEALVKIRELLARFDFRKSKKQAIGEDTVSLGEWIESETERLSAIMPNIPEWIKSERIQRHYKDLTLNQLLELDEVLKAIEHIAKRENQMYQARKGMTFEFEKRAILNEIYDVHPEVFNEDLKPKEYRKDTKPLLQDLNDKITSAFDAELIGIESIIDIISGGKGNQIFDSLFERMSESQDNQTALMRDMAEFIKPYIDAYSYAERVKFAVSSSRKLVESTGQYFTRDQRVAVALYAGSIEGRQRLNDGNGYTDQQINDIISSLDSRDMEFVKGFWRMSDALIWEKLKAVDERTKGIAPKKVEPLPYTTQHGEMPGGYVPLAYDGDLDIRIKSLQDDSAITDLRGGGVFGANTKQGASHERFENVNKPLNLSLAAISSKINETVHDVTHREAVLDTYRLLKDKEIGNAIKQIMGPKVYNAMLVKVRETAVRPTVPHGISENLLWYARKNMLVNMMGASFNTFMINVLGVFPAVARVGPVRFIRALGKMYGPGSIERHKWILEISQYMRERHNDIDRELNTEKNRFTGKGVLTPQMSFWFAGLALMDKAITRPLWMAAYDETMQNTNDPELSRQYADRVVRQSQGSGRPIDLPQIAGGVGAAGEFKRTMTMVYTFFNSQLVMLIRQKRLSELDWNDGKIAKASMGLALTYMYVVVIPSTLESIARGQCGDDPDAIDYLYCSGRSSVFYMANFFPLFRDIIPYTWKQFDPEVRSYGVRLSPIESGLESLARTPKSIADVIEGADTDSDIRNIFKGLGFALGLPGAQAYRSLEGFQALSDGKTVDPTVLLTGDRNK